MLLGLPALSADAQALGKCERLIVTGSPDAPPYLWRDPQDPAHLIGASADLLRQVAGELGLKVEVLYGGKRSQARDEVRSGRMDLLLDAPIALDEQDSLDYIHPALLYNDLKASAQPVDQPGLFLAVSHNSACNDPWLRGQLAKKMTELPASGLTEAALQRNLERWKAQSQPVSAPKP
ncbi:hypothetical protein NUH87_25860 [Pseudomonas batumici]